ncbi:MAG TPA: hypothetical protein VIV61_16230, partial [Candidatus Ozemobacteraceae bacterium]
HGTFPAGAIGGLLLALAVQRLTGRTVPSPLLETIIPGGGFLTALAVAGLDPFSLARTPAMRLPGGLLFGLFHVLLVPVQGAIPAGFSALLLVNVLTPLGDALIVTRRARQWIVTDGQTA